MSTTTIDPPAAQPIVLTPAQRTHRKSVLFLRWLRRIHLWVGLWGAAIGLLFGATGFLLNHRAILKIPVEKSVQRQAQLALPEGEAPFDSAEAMAAWLQKELALGSEPGRVRAEPARPVPWGDKTLKQPARWSIDFASPGRIVRAEHWVGNRTVKVETIDSTVIGLLFRLHTASGVSAFWVLLADTIAGGLVLLSVTGLLLWSRLHPIRLSSLGVSLGALLAAAVYLLAATSAHAQAAEPAQESVVVTATRGSKAVEKIPGAISVISRGEIEAQGLVSEDPSALLAVQVPGYAPSRQKLSNFGEGLRGRNALLLLDGIPQTNPLRFGAREGYHADPMIVERIEVVSGASAVQGMGATGGIVNTITRQPRELGTHHTVELKYGTQLRHDTNAWKAGVMMEHKSEGQGEGEQALDVLAYMGLRQQDVGVDGDGRYLATESLNTADDVFLKVGHDVGAQRLQLMLNRYTARGFDDWVDVPGDRSTGLPTSARPGTIAWDPPLTTVSSASLEWTHAELAGGFAALQLFKQDFHARYTGGLIATFQDEAIAPQGTLIDQSEIVADKWGLRTSWVRPDLFVRGLEFTAGLDLLHDTSSQVLTQTGRTWVPPLEFESLAPFAQLEYEWGDVTVRGGLRDEQATLNVETYRTLAFYGSREVQGGERSAHKLVKSLGAVWRLGRSGWSTFASYNEGFGPPDAGLILRAVKTDGQSVASLVDLQPVVTENREIGVAWRGQQGSLAASVYDSRSELGSQIIVTNGIGVVQRVPIEVKGVEFTGEWWPQRDWRLNATYARTRGRTASAAGEPLDLDLGARSQGPDKLLLAAQWAFAPAMSARLTASRYLPRHVNAGKTSGVTSLEENFGGYTVLDAVARWASPWGELGLGIENLLDRQYITYYAQAHYAGSDDDYYAGRGRTVTASWRRSF